MQTSGRERGQRRGGRKDQVLLGLPNQRIRELHALQVLRQMRLDLWSPLHVAQQLCRGIQLWLLLQDSVVRFLVHRISYCNYCHLPFAVLWWAHKDKDAVFFVAWSWSTWGYRWVQYWLFGTDFISGSFNHAVAMAQYKPETRGDYHLSVHHTRWTKKERKVASDAEGQAEERTRSPQGADWRKMCNSVLAEFRGSVL